MARAPVDPHANPDAVVGDPPPAVEPVGTSLLVDPDREPARVLAVDDDPAITRLVRRRLEQEGMTCAESRSGEEALELAAVSTFDVIITDVRMPGLSGLELLQRLKTQDPLIQVLIMTGHLEVDPAVQAVRLHADDYLLKPVDLSRLVDSVRHMVQHRRLVLATREYRRSLESRLQEQSARLERLYLASIQALVTALEAKDPYTRGHSERVTRYTLRLAEAMDTPDRHALAVGAQLHDLGKIGTRDDVLRKPARLSSLEEAHIRRHPLIGVRILRPIVDDARVLKIVRHHHERWDGGGYPDGLAGTAIPLHARIVAVADALDAITSPRAYRPARSWSEALDELVACRGTHFDPGVVDAAVDVLREPEDAGRPASA